MKLPETVRKAQEENLIPLINVVFLLLIFFMLAGTLTRPELFSVEPPFSRTEQPPPAEEGIELLVGSDGRLALDDVSIAVAELESRLQALLAGRDAPPVRVKADADIRAEQLHRVMDALRAAGVGEFTLLTVQGD